MDYITKLNQIEIVSLVLIAGMSIISIGSVFADIVIR